MSRNQDVSVGWRMLKRLNGPQDFLGIVTRVVKLRSVPRVSAKHKHIYHGMVRILVENQHFVDHFLQELMVCNVVFHISVFPRVYKSQLEGNKQLHQFIFSALGHEFPYANTVG